MKRPVRLKNLSLLTAIIRSGHNSTTLAAACNLHASTVSNLLNQRRQPTPETASAIAKVLHSTPEQLFGETAKGGAR